VIVISIDQLRYVRLGTRDLAAAIGFAQRMLGLQLVEQTDTTAFFRSDARAHTLVYVVGDPREQAVGFEIYGAAAFEQAIAVLTGAGLSVTRGDAEHCAARRVRGLASFRDPGGTIIELVVRPMNSGWRYFPTRDAGITGLEAVALRANDVAACESLWTQHFNGRVRDWAGEAAFIGFDDAHHRIAYYPSRGVGILAIEFAVESVDLLMRNSYVLQSAQVTIVHGPGRRPTSNQMFLTFTGPDGVLFSFVAEGDRIANESQHRPRQFPAAPGSLCAWGSQSPVPEFNAMSAVAKRPA
jgi:2,3-dihydroxy-p-cumate/2,3-dihydroxybenzoate 3,4-dioxygenase